MTVNGRNHHRKASSRIRAPLACLTIFLVILLGIGACRPAVPAAPSPSPTVKQIEFRGPSAMPTSEATPLPTATAPPLRTVSPAPSPHVVVPVGDWYGAKLHHQGATTDPRHVFARLFADVAYARTGGRLRIEVTAAGTRYDAAGELEALGANSIQFALPRVADLARDDAAWNVLDLPLLLTPAAASRLAGSPAAESLWNGMSRRGIVGLALIDLRDPVIIYTRDRPLRSLSDFEGLRARTYLADATLHNDWLNLFGASAVSLTAPEVYPALQRDQIDAVLSTISAADELRLPEVARQGTLIPVSSVPMAVAANSLWWSVIPDDLRRAITDVILPETQAQFDHYIADYVAERRDRAAQRGQEYVQPPPDLLQALRTRTEAELYPRYREQFGDLITQIQGLQ